jgi:hypothetical protein
MNIEVQESVEVFNVIVSEEGNVKVILNDLGEQGIQGKSAYEIAIENGFVGTEDQYVSLSTGQIEKISGESIPSYTPVAIINNMAYKLDPSNSTHQFAFYGFSINGTSIGQTCIIQERGEIELIGWGLTPNTQYLAGPLGTLITNNNSPTNFTKVVGYSVTSDKLTIIKDYTTINKI